MSLENLKITVYEDNVKDLPDYPSDGGYTAQRLKEIFDGRTDKEIKEKFNALVDELVARFSEVDAEIEAGEKGLRKTSSDLGEHKVSEDAHAAIFQALREEITAQLEELSEVSAAQKEYTDNAVNGHNKSSAAHSDIRGAITNIANLLANYVTEEEVDTKISEAISSIPNGDEVSY